MAERRIGPDPRGGAFIVADEVGGRAAPAVLGAFLLLAVAIIAWQEYRVRQLQHAVSDAVACRADPVCQDREAAAESLVQEYAVQSGSGRWFFSGQACASAGCQGQVAGYQWAEKIGATKTGACVSPDPEFRAGCLVYVKAYDDRPMTADLDGEPPATRWGG